MVWDVTGMLLFLLWLVLPPVYVVALGRHYVRRCADATQQALWAHGELREALNDLRSIQEAEASPRGAPPIVPSTRECRARTAATPGLSPREIPNALRTGARN